MRRFEDHGGSSTKDTAVILSGVVVREAQDKAVEGPYQGRFCLAAQGIVTVHHRENTFSLPNESRAAGILRLRVGFACANLTLRSE